MQTTDNTQPKKLVLLVEDYDFAAESLQELIESLDYNVIRVSNAGQGIDICKEKDFQIVLLDVELLAFGAYWFTEEVRKSGQSMPIIGYKYLDVSPIIMARALDSGMQDVSTHWVSRYMLVQTLNKWCPNHVTQNYKHYW